MLISGGVQYLYVSSLFGHKAARVSELILPCLVGTFGGGIGNKFEKMPKYIFPELKNWFPVFPYLHSGKLNIAGWKMDPE